MHRPVNPRRHSQLSCSRGQIVHNISAVYFRSSHSLPLLFCFLNWIGVKSRSQPQVIASHKTLPLRPIESDHKVQIIGISELLPSRSLCSFIHELQANSRTNWIAALKEKAYTHFLYSNSSFWNKTTIFHSMLISQEDSVLFVLERANRKQQDLVKPFPGGWKISSAVGCTPRMLETQVQALPQRENPI